MRRTRSKKSPAHGVTIGALTATWAKASKDRARQVVAKTVIAEIGHLQPAALTPLIVGAIVQRWKERLSRYTVVSYRHRLKQLAETLETFGAPKIKIQKAPPGYQRAVTATGDELVRLMANPQPHLRLYMLLYFQCGLRSAEALAVTPRSWNPEQHTVTIKTKGGRIRTVEVTPEVEVMFAAAHPEPSDDRSFIELLRGWKVTKDSIRQAWEKHRKDCGISPKVTAHDLRRTAATIVYHNTKDLRVAQQLLGHLNLNSTLRYIAPMAPDEARRYAELLRFDKFHSEVQQ